MIFLKQIKVKLHKKVINWRIKVTPIALPDGIKRKRNIFLYFDYEREFGGHQTDITDGHIADILNFLDEFTIKTTWFTVGKIFEKYPDSINLITEYVHELGSHTYNHTPTTKLNKIHLAEDFSAFKNISKNYTVMGFHPPQGQWNMKTLKMLSYYGFKYELAAYSGKNKGIPTKILNTKSITRFLTIGDDWLVYANQLKEEQAFNYFKNLFSKCKTGHVTGIGFHPWILFHNKIYFNAFKQFIKYLMEFEDVQIKTAAEYLKIIKKNT
jgi:peptidoglycan/xylan/chitin deacetylase (PgdA/CDA1 family)